MVIRCFMKENLSKRILIIKMKVMDIMQKIES